MILSSDQKSEFITTLLQAMIRNDYRSELLLGEIDHSPSEQLELQVNHTTALLLSEGDEIRKLAIDVGRKAGRHGVLRKWAGASPTYRERFAKALEECLPNHRVYVLALRASGHTISASEGYFLEQLRLSSVYKLDTVQRTVTIGPLAPLFTAHKTHRITLPRKRAVMVLHIAHWIVRVYTALETARTQLGLAPNLGIQFFSDRMPGNGEMETVLLPIFEFSIGTDCIRWVNFLDDHPEDHLADNIAGWLSKAPNTQSLERALNDGHGFFYFEEWHPL